MSLILIPALARAGGLSFFSFEKDWRRYPSPDVIVQLLASKFPDVDITQIPPRCVRVTDQVRGSLGDDRPVVGAPLAGQPTAALVDWLHQCVISFVRADKHALLNMNAGALERRLGTSLWKGCQAQNPAQDLVTTRESCDWSKLSSTEQQQFLEAEILRLLGPEEVLIEFEIASSGSELRQQVGDEIQDLTRTDSARYAFLDVRPSSGRLNVIDAAVLTEYLLLLTDSLRY